ncbi:carboxyvinyl-carboxyphosphonate phosphorylmutase [Lentilactobacillus curieae]|uniref:Carboxyvinyl-carboxyphosphonate phosphorylmutase n=1 Tax=Lentilactobacillus curieae TaxID=1138822 RepID=A0A1S6QHA5_9LACO|nr:isocitrate lyase/phosphoenolpyruvate mutase family protein [Lentilactobacillus curieae]AQW20983.1 carboxyvinyl-carboxyphosphonate phosphorylmutase [Lentilactobacillus curieae]
MHKLLRQLTENAGTIIPAAGNGNTLQILNGYESATIYLDGTLAANNLLAENSQGLLTLSEYSKFLRDMRLKTDKMLIADLQAGFGSPLNTYYAAQELERSGATAMILNDQTYPAHSNSHPIITSAEDLLGKTRAALDGISEESTELWVKLEGMKEFGLEEIRTRINYLAKAGAHAIVIDHFTDYELASLTNEPSPLPLIATWTPDTNQIAGITAWLDKGYLEKQATAAKTAALNTINYGGLEYAKR